MAASGQSPFERSSDFAAMLPFWTKIDDIRGGAEKMRAATTRYLPRFPSEKDEEYRDRVATSPWTPLYVEASENLAAKPFEREVAFVEGTASARVEALAEDIDGQGNHLFAFSQRLFQDAIDYGVAWVFVDYTRMQPGATLADERAAGARPIWHYISARRMLAVYHDFVGGQMVYTHARIDETSVERDGWGEKTVYRVRVLNRELLEGGGGYGPATWQLYEQESTSSGATNWQLIDEGVLTIGEIPIRPLLLGERVDGTWKINAPLRDLADMQITEYQLENNRHRVQTMTAFPMLKALGVVVDDDKPRPDLPIGPRVTLYAPSNADGTHGDFGFIEPSGAAGTMLREDLEQHRAEMREAGRQPLMSKSGGITATQVAVTHAKASSAVKAWALRLKDMLEECFTLTAEWLGEPRSPEVFVFTDFAVETAGTEGMQIVLDLEERGLISREATLTEAKRRNILAPEYDADEDLETLAEEEPDEPSAEEIAAAMVPPVNGQAGEPPPMQPGIGNLQ